MLKRPAHICPFSGGEPECPKCGGRVMKTTFRSDAVQGDWLERECFCGWAWGEETADSAAEMERRRKPDAAPRGAVDLEDLNRALLVLAWTYGNLDIFEGMPEALRDTVGGLLGVNPSLDHHEGDVFICDNKAKHDGGRIAIWAAEQLIPTYHKTLQEGDTLLTEWICPYCEKKYMFRMVAERDMTVGPGADNSDVFRAVAVQAREKFQQTFSEWAKGHGMAPPDGDEVE